MVRSENVDEVKEAIEHGKEIVAEHERLNSRPKIHGYHLKLLVEKGLF